MAGLGEEQIIALLSAAAGERADVRLGIGDDGAVLRPPPDRELVSVMDTLNEGVHFPARLPGAAVAHRALAANLSDLAAMGAEPAWASLALSLPRPDAAWLKSFVQGFRRLAGRYRLALIGGDTVRGPLAVTLHLTGFVEAGAALRRDGARGGDLVVVSGVLGEAAAGLVRWLDGETGAEGLGQRFLWPEPRVGLGRALAGLATAAIDISDGLVLDLTRLSRASGLGAVLHLDRLPISEHARRALGASEARRLALVGGDDYELCFTIDRHAADRLRSLGERQDCALTVIGEISDVAGIRYLESGREVTPDLGGAWRHFGEDVD